MSPGQLSAYRQVWLVDFEFHQPPGEMPEPTCMVAKNFHTGQILRLWHDQLTALTAAPFGVGPDALFVAYYASAELGCFLSLGWPLPERVLDLFVEFRCHVNGMEPPDGYGLIGALAWHRLQRPDAAENNDMRALAQRGGPYTATERDALLAYCADDVNALGRLLACTSGGIDLPRALLRGRYMTAAARIEQTGVPLDCDALDMLRRERESMKTRLIGEVDRDYGVFEGDNFKRARFEQWAIAQNIGRASIAARWPSTTTRAR